MRDFGIFCLTLLMIVYKAFALTVLYNWFIFGTFTTIALTLPVALGVTYCFIALSPIAFPKDKDTDNVKFLLTAFLSISMLLVFGYVTTLFM